MPYTMSIEAEEFKSFINGFHLGTDEALARKLIEERFHGRVNAGIRTVTIALMCDGKMVDVYDGSWMDRPRHNH